MNILIHLRKLFKSTGISSEQFDAEDKIILLCKNVLASKEIIKAEELAIDIMSKGTRKKLAIEILQRKIGTHPKRPLYYITQLFLPRLPSHTRDIMKYLGDYLDQLLKYTVREKRKGFIHFERSMGPNLHALKNIISPELQEELLEYNKLLYVPAKHDFDVPKDRNHRFTLREVILSCFLTIKFAEEIKTISSFARKYANDMLLD